MSALTSDFTGFMPSRNKRGRPPILKQESATSTFTQTKSEFDQTTTESTQYNLSRADYVRKCFRLGRAVALENPAMLLSV